MEKVVLQVELVTHLLLVHLKEILEEILQTHNQELVAVAVVLVLMEQIQRQVVVVMVVLVGSKRMTSDDDQLYNSFHGCLPPKYIQLHIRVLLKT